MPFDVGELLRAIGDIAFVWLPIIMFALIIYLLWRSLALMPRVKTTHVKPSSRSAVTWDEVAGLDEAKKELREVVEFLRHPKRFSRLGARVPKGILLYGPPGTGKTLLAKAVAHESGASFYSQSASAFVEMFAGLGAARIRKLFEQARNEASAIIFIDELDAVGMKRMGGGLNREQDQTLNQLLVELDGFNESEGGQVIVMGASNRLEDLDPALLRPGRFDRQILVSSPDLAGRQEILGVHTRGKPLSPDVDLQLIARQTAGLTGADLANVANEAAIFAAREDRNDISQANFEAAMERVVAGLQQRRVVTEKERRILAYHEAGHAVMAYLMGDPVQKATIVARGDALGYTFHLPDEERYLHTREELIDWMKIGLAGRAAEQVVFGRVTNGAANDLEKVTSLARAMVFEYGMSEGVVSRTMRADNYALSEETKRLRDSEQARLTDGAYEEAIRLLEKHRAALDRVAGALLDKETLNREQLEALLHDTQAESHASETVGTIRVLPQTEHA
ncbi:MAG TPA: AAA family ATPase [Gaiellaceae bacterium]|nr:AAA family ATPase [Gaiellaceae bacterium]